FGQCGTGGDMFTFVMRAANVDFADALKILAERAGVSLSAPLRPLSDRNEARLVDANEAAATFYQRLLLDSLEGAGARRYLLDERGLTYETINRFELGLSPSGWTDLHRSLKSEGFSDKELLDAGLIVEGDQGI